MADQHRTMPDREEPHKSDHAPSTEERWAASARAEEILESIGDAFYAIDRDFRFIYVNRRAEESWGRARAELLGRRLQDVFPQTEGSSSLALQRRAMAERAPGRYETLSPVLKRWIGVTMYPSAQGLSVYFQDIHDRRIAEDALRESEERYRRIVETTSEGVWVIDADSRTTYVNAQMARMLGGTVEEMAGVSMFDFMDGEGKALAAVNLERRRAGVEEQHDFKFRRKDGTALWAIISTNPLLDPQGQYVGALGMLTDITERKFLEAERERLLAEAQARAAREALLNHIGESIRATTDPDGVQATAAVLLGRALGADRCYFSAYDPSGHGVRISRDFRRPGLPSVAGDYPLTDYGPYVDALYAGGTAVVDDAGGPDVPPVVRRVLAGFGFRAFLAVPLLDGGRFVAAVAAAMHDGPRVWMPDEIALMEAVLTQTRTAAEAARAARRERTISRQLQAALQPPFPDAMPGMRLANYFRAALADTEGVGGDFYDVFRLDGGGSALVVGDLSGKGLEAAAHVAVVRNMLRAFLHSKPTLAGAITALNRVLALNGLLSGFATLWVGCYDGATGELSYVNCGQEPALLRRAATGRVEELPSSGPVLGASEGGVFEERTVALAPGDVLAVFTDGLTECGASRRDMLGVEGVSALLAPPLGPDEAGNAGAVAEAVKSRLVAGVEAASRGGVARDDMCLLVGVVQGPSGHG